MIGYLKGTVVEAFEGTVIIDVGGIGYTVEMPASSLAELPPAGQQVQLYTTLMVRDDQINLYGFMDRNALMVFKVLLQVSGVGPRLALNVLSVMSPKELVTDIAKGETARIRSVHGVGKKTAARICVDLKEKASRILLGDSKQVPHTSVQTPGNNEEIMDDALSALVNLGYRHTEAKKAVSEILTGKGVSKVDQLIRLALQRLSKVK